MGIIKITISLVQYSSTITKYPLIIVVVITNSKKKKFRINLGEKMMENTDSVHNISSYIINYKSLFIYIHRVTNFENGWKREPPFAFATPNSLINNMQWLSQPQLQRWFISDSFSNVQLKQCKNMTQNHNP